MTIFDAVQRGRRTRPRKHVIHGSHGSGKSTFASTKYPEPIVLSLEDGVGDIDVDSVDIKSWDHCREAIIDLLTNEHPYQTVVIDSVDWLERLGSEKIELEQTDLGYGRLGREQGKLMQRICDGLTAIRDKGMWVVVIAHSEDREHREPTGEMWDVRGPKLTSKANPILLEWADEIFYAQQTTVVKKQDAGFNQTRGIAKSLGEYVMLCNGSPAIVTKKRVQAVPASFDQNIERSEFLTFFQQG